MSSATLAGLVASGSHGDSVEHVILPIVVVLALVRVGFRLRKRARCRAATSPSPSPSPSPSLSLSLSGEPAGHVSDASTPAPSSPSPAPTTPAPPPSRRSAALRSGGTGRLTGSPVALVAYREIRERFRTRFFRIGTIIILLGVAAAVVIPTLHSNTATVQRVGIVGTLSAPARAVVVAAGAAIPTAVSFVEEPSLAAAERGVRSGDLALAVVDGSRLVVEQDPNAAKNAGSATSTTVLALAQRLGILTTLRDAGLTPAQIDAVSHPKSLPITFLQKSTSSPSPSRSTAKTTVTYGLVLLFVLMSQYGTWILMGVVEEKSSRVVEVLLAAVRPRQLLGGKVLGIGTVALTQGILIVAVALVVSAATGSPLIKGAAPLQVLTALCWLVVGYAFYCWVYAAAGSLAERQEHVQSLAFPLQLPILVGYIISLTSLGGSSPSTLVKVLAYLPPTAPFAMQVLVAFGAVQWWQFLVSVLLTVAATVGVSHVAATIYGRAVLRTGRRIKLSEVLRAAR